MPFITQKRLRRIRSEARREGYENGSDDGYRQGYRDGHYDGAIQAHNNALATVNNALDGGQRPARRMRARLHDTTVDRVATIVEDRERAAVQRAVDIAARRVAAGKRIKVKVKGVVIRPTPAKAAR
jgi:flagellar biosynthesis/type III secretory pathway protein FliH